jgi:photosystem II stability/assembly factor-like uncharacterized protein
MTKHAAAFAFTLAALAAPARAVAPATPAAQWKAIGPWSENVEDVALDPKNPKVLYAATRNGIFKSTDGAETWVRKSKGMDKAHALCIAIDPKTPSTLLVGAYSGGPFKSIDGGETWKVVKPTGGAALYVLGRSPLHHIAIDPVNPKNVLFTGLYKSTTGGAEIADVDSLPGGNNFRHVAFDPKNPKIVWAAGGSDLMKTADFGATWSKVDFGGPAADSRLTVIHPKSGEILVGTDYSGLYKSADGGKTWKSVGEGLSERPRIDAVAWDPVNPQTVYVSSSLKHGDEDSVFRSADGGETFTDVGKDLPWEPIKSIVIDPGDPKVVYAGTTFSGVFKTTDGGKTWNEKSQGFESSFRVIRALAAAGPGTLFATTYGTVYRTTDDGKTWQRMRSTIQKGLDYEFIGAGGADKPVVIAGADKSRLVYSADGGETWGDPPRSAPLNCIVRDPKDPRVFYMCSDGGGILRGGDASGWKPLSDDSNTTFIALAFDPQNAQNVWAATYHNLQRSVNGGKKWKEWKPFDKVKGGVVRPADSRHVLAIAFDPKNAKTIYVATQEDGLFKSADGGETWSSLSLIGEKLTSFALDPSDPLHLVVGTPEKGVSVSKDGGATWTSYSAGLPDDESKKKKEKITAVVFGSGAPASLYVATEDGVYRAQ